MSALGAAMPSLGNDDNDDDNEMATIDEFTSPQLTLPALSASPQTTVDTLTELFDSPRPPRKTARAVDLLDDVSPFIESVLARS